jgi:predicted nucleotidyltransferase
MLKSKDAAALEEFLRSLRSALGKNLLGAKLFGSKATGKDQRDSDIDVLVVVNQNGVEIEDQVLDIVFDVNIKHDVYISPRGIDRSILSDPCGASRLFFKPLQKKGFRCEGGTRVRTRRCFIRLFRRGPEKISKSREIVSCRILEAANFGQMADAWKQSGAFEQRR